MLISQEIDMYAAIGVTLIGLNQVVLAQWLIMEQKLDMTDVINVFIGQIVILAHL
jgi:ABC-type uncharacterized transport system permease subunit